MEDKKNNNSGTMPEKIDITSILDDTWRGLKRFWILGIVLVLLCGGSLGYISKKSYVPYYSAYTTFVVETFDPYEDAKTYSDYNSRTATQLAETFPYILNSRALRNVVCKELGVDSIQEKITAEAANSDTALFTIRVESQDPQTAFDVMQAVVDHYPEIARYIIGETELTIMDTSGIPQSPSNQQQWKRQAVAGGIIGLILTELIILLFSMTRKTIRRDDEIKKYINITSLGGVPAIRLKKRSKDHMQRILLDEANSTEAFNESIRGIRNRVIAAAKKEQAKVLVVTSAMSGEGKSMVASNLAVALAKKRYRVLLLDGDFRKPSLHHVFDINEERNYMEELLNGTNGNSIKGHKIPGIPLLIFNGKKESGLTAASLDERKLRRLFQSMRKACDFVIIDTPPCDVVSDATVFARCADAAILVVKQDYSRIDLILQAAETISESGIPMLGYVLNHVKVGLTQSGYGYGYGKYGYGYGRYGTGKYGYGSSKNSKFGFDNDDNSAEDDEILVSEGKKPENTSKRNIPLWMRNEDNE